MAFPTDQTVSRLGAQNQGADTRALFLKLFAGEVLTSFEEKNIAMGLHRVRTISNGKSASFPMTGTTTASYHTAGQLIEADAMNHAERIVTVDDLLISKSFIANIDEAMNHYDVRSIYSKEMGHALANAADRNILKIVATAANMQSSADLPAAQRLTDEVFTNNVAVGTNGVASTGTDIANAIYGALEEFDSKDVTGEKVCVLPPASYYKLFGSQDVNQLSYMNRDVGGSGSMSTGQAPVIGGVKILMSNHVPTTDESTTSVTPTSANFGSYTGDFSGIEGMIFSADAAATVKLLDLGVESEYQISRQGTLMVAKYAMGHNVLRPACAINLVTA